LQAVPCHPQGGSGFAQYARGHRQLQSRDARRYTDISFLTSDPEITEGVSEVFNFPHLQSRSPDFKTLMVGR